MISILDNLFISSAVSAAQEELLSKSGIKSVISIGCATSDQFASVRYLSYPLLLDTPETNIISIFDQTNEYIRLAFNNDEKVLVHCVYGQSRSATVIIAYLLSTNMTLQNAMNLMKSKNPSTCINPGFLAQLFCVSLTDFDSVERRFFNLCPIVVGKRLNLEHADARSVGHKRSLIINEADGGKEKTVICRVCKCTLAVSSAVLSQSFLPKAFVVSQEDGFWRGYRPNRSKVLAPPVTLPMKGIFATFPQEWMLAQVYNHRDACGLGDKYTAKNTQSSNRDETAALDPEECELNCPDCHGPVGFWRSKSLNLFGEYNLCDLFALNAESARIKRVINIDL
jgi:hypothetical protein